MRDISPTDDLVLPMEGLDPTRRSFLKLAGFGVATATLAGCSRGAVRMVVPRLKGEPGVTPGRAYEIATTCGGCEARCGVVARCRDGRPIKLEGNPEHALSRGGLCAVGQATLLDVYDGKRFDGPRLRGESCSWDELDSSMRQAIDAAPGKVRLLTRTVTSPSTRAWIERFVAAKGGAHVEWDPRSASALLDAYGACFGRRMVPHYRFERARVIAAFDADFLGTWLAPVEFAKGYAARRRVADDNPQMSRHVQIESRLSLSGCAADQRLVVAPWEVRPALAAVCEALAKHAGRTSDLASESASAPRQSDLEHLAGELWEARGECLVVCGSDDPGAQALAAYANELLGNHGNTVDLERPSLARRGDDRALFKLVQEMDAGAVDVLVIQGLDPLYELPDDSGFREALAKVGTVVTLTPMADDTSELAHGVAPEPHALESWDDAEAVAGHFSLTQPTVPPLRSARTLRESLARWTGETGKDADLLRAHWRTAVFPHVRNAGAFDGFFDRVLHDGYVEVAPVVARPPWSGGRVKELLAASPPAAIPAGDDLALILFSKVGVPEGRNAHNPWLQELPDPLTTATWDSIALMAPETAHERGLKPGDVVRISTPEGATVEVPIRALPGVHPRVVAVPIGYGVRGTDRFSRIGPSWLEGRLTTREGEPVGSRASGLLALGSNGLRSTGRGVGMAATGAAISLASTQDHHRLEVPSHLATKRGAVRDAVLATSLDRLREDPTHAVHRHQPAEANLWPEDHVPTGPRWGMVVDLAACIGCSGCVVACQAENNVPSVGKDEVERHREMTWLRIDRYFSGSGDDLRVSHQPMMCQHCANAPCETVCPVLATAHSSDGLNQQVYNRCVGTRYCANNCPYKTRRFNWFDYPRGEELRNLALNPDVTVRTRGVMEKCSMCVQRIQEGKAEAGRLGRPVADGDIQTACQQSCPADAIAFGDLNDAESAVAKQARGPRAYAVLSELNVLPGVTYLAGVRNAPEGTGVRHE